MKCQKRLAVPPNIHLSSITGTASQVSLQKLAILTRAGSGCWPSLLQKARLHHTSKPPCLLGQSSLEFKNLSNQARTGRMSCCHDKRQGIIVLLGPSLIKKRLALRCPPHRPKITIESLFTLQRAALTYGLWTRGTMCFGHPLTARPFL